MKSKSKSDQASASSRKHRPELLFVPTPMGVAVREVQPVRSQR